jgi:hypothetical protein
MKKFKLLFAAAFIAGCFLNAQAQEMGNVNYGGNRYQKPAAAHAKYYL